MGATSRRYWLLSKSLCRPISGLSFPFSHGNKTLHERGFILISQKFLLLSRYGKVWEVFSVHLLILNDLQLKIIHMWKKCFEGRHIIISNTTLNNCMIAYSCCTFPWTLSLYKQKILYFSLKESRKDSKET